MREAARQDVIDRVLEGDGHASTELRRAAFANQGALGPARTLLDKVARNAYKVTDEDIAEAKAGGLAEDEIFELAVAAALGQATRQLAAARAALAAATTGARASAPKPGPDEA